MRLQRIEIKRNGEYVSVRPEDFLALPLAERLSFILERTIRFYDAGGNEIPLQEGNRILRDQQSAGPQPAPSNGHGGGSMSLSAFLELPMNTRLPLILERRVTFRDADGAEIPLKQALQIMRDIHADGSLGFQHAQVSVEPRT
jgi:hypothetical protein